MDLVIETQLHPLNKSPQLTIPRVAGHQAQRLQKRPGLAAHGARDGGLGAWGKGEHFRTSRSLAQGWKIGI